jgi:hypothetical protein
MKKITFFFLVVSLFRVSAQTLTQSFNEPHVGDVDPGYPLDTSAYTNGLPLNIKGNNVTWNFTSLQPISPSDTDYYVSPSSVAGASAYVGCTVVQKSGLLNTFIKSSTTPTTQTEILGATSSSLSFLFSNSAIAVKYPVSYGSGSTDNIAGTYTVFTYNGPCTGVITTTADGFGTLNLPGHSYTNVLRIKSVQSLTLNQGIFPVGTGMQTIYEFYHASQKFPLLTLSYNSFGLITSSSPTVSGSARGSANSFTVVGLKENTLDANAITIYPNPVKDNLNIVINGSVAGKEIELYDQLGRLVLYSDTTNNIDVSTLKSGIYILQIKTDRGIAQKKLVKE